VTGITVRIKWDFTCAGCDHYQPSTEKGKMGYCPIKKKKVAKTYGCRKSTVLAIFAGVMAEP